MSFENISKLTIQRVDILNGEWSGKCLKEPGRWDGRNRIGIRPGQGNYETDDFKAIQIPTRLGGEGVKYIHT